MWQYPLSLRWQAEGLPRGSPSLRVGKYRIRIVAYVDGFSVYYACYKGPTKVVHAHLKWLDYRAVFEAMFPHDDVTLVRIYTAIAPNPPGDDDQSTRHDTYRRALMTCPGVEVHVGRFQKAKREAMLAHPPPGIDPAQTVFIYQEKQSDVSLASHLVLDAIDDRFDRAVLFTNDSDFVTPIRLVRERTQREVIVLSPDVTINRELKKAASVGRIFDRGLLFKCQLPDPVIDAEGREIRMPDRWRKQTEPE
ncbi:MAG TPA: NYN domain-containing protein [Thermomicrobiales bacterium]|nr:NYN domain-containing protein [Thermomicrobiales bacterium]